MMDTPLEALVNEWLRQDKVGISNSNAGTGHRSNALTVITHIPHCQNESTRKEIQDLWNGGKTEELEKRMRYQFVTAFELRLSNVSLISFALGFVLSSERLVCTLTIALFIFNPIVYIRSEGKNGSWMVPNE